MFGRSSRIRHLASACSWAIFASTLPAAALAAEAASAPEGHVPSVDEQVTVVGTRFLDVQPERDLDELAIESYGQSTIDELLGEIAAELGEDEQPLILINGERIDNLEDIGALPVEALKNVQILPRGTAVRVGGTPGQRVVNLKLKSQMRSATLLIAPKFATEGDWWSTRGEATLTYIKQDTRANLTFKMRPESDLLESERGIIQPDPIHPFAISGNVIGYPDTSGEIDPLLSAAAGEIVTVAPIPDNANPTLLDFVPNANEAAITDLGDYRTLRAKTRNYDLNGTFATRLTPWLTGNIAVRLNHSTRRSLRGLPAALFTLSPTNASSPFSTTVAIAQYGTDPLASRSEHNGGDFTLNLNAKFGNWTGFFTGGHSEYKDVTKTERIASGTIAIPDSVDAFGSDLFDLATFRTDRSESKTNNDKLRLSFTGPLVKLPAGDVQATFEGSYIHNDLRSTSDFSLISQSRHFKRGETELRAALDVPITDRDGFGGAIGELNLSGELSRVHYSDAGNVTNYQAGFAWEPHPILRLEGDIERTNLPATVQYLGNAIIITPDVRTFDPLTGDTVDVTQITGGNPDLDPEKDDVHRISAIVRLIERLNLELNAEYTDTKERNFVSSLPEASAAVMLAFPTRFLRDPDGVLTTVDLRPVNFDEHREKRFRYGLSMNTKLGGGSPTVKPKPVAADSDDEDSPREEARSKAARGSQPTRLSLTASHSIVFEDKITIRPGLPSVDLLDGGAIGIGGGRVRHQLDGTASITSGGAGLRVTANWRGKSKLNALDEGTADTLFFSPVFILNLRAFTDVHRFFPDSDWARSMRLSLNVYNATNDRQEVRDSFGDTPLRYQAAYRDPVGRMIEIELRKVF